MVERRSLDPEREEDRAMALEHQKTLREDAVRIRSDRILLPTSCTYFSRRLQDPSTLVPYSGL